jgi:hypothetical protein
VLLLVAAGPVSALIGNAAPGVARDSGARRGGRPLTMLGNVAVAAVAIAVLALHVARDRRGLRRLSAA